MEYEHLCTYCIGAKAEARDIKADWKDMYGHKNYQAAIDDLVGLVENAVDLFQQYALDDRNALKQYLEDMRSMKERMGAMNAR